MVHIKVSGPNVYVDIKNKKAICLNNKTYDPQTRVEFTTQYLMAKKENKGST